MNLMPEVTRSETVTFPQGRRVVTIRPRVPDETLVLLNRDQLFSDWFLRFLPVWVAEVVIDICSDDVVMQIDVLQEYRQVIVQIGPEFYNKSREELKLTMVHEVMHVYTGILESFTEVLIESLGLEDDVVYQKQYDISRESVVQDLAVLVMSIMDTGVRRGPV